MKKLLVDENLFIYISYNQRNYEKVRLLGADFQIGSLSRKILSGNWTHFSTHFRIKRSLKVDNN